MPDQGENKAHDKGELGDHWWVKVLRFTNCLDPDFDMLSPTRIQAWAATLGAFASIAHDVLATTSTFAQAAGNGVSTIVAGWWAHRAHTNYNDSKRIQRGK